MQVFGARHALRVCCCGRIFTMNGGTRSAKYLEIAQTLRREILEGKFANREHFPSEVALARRFGASRPTVERALRELKRAGLLEARAGSGFYLTFAARNSTGVIGVIAPDYGKIDFFTDSN